jgi:hypothetical protein
MPGEFRRFGSSPNLGLSIAFVLARAALNL